MRDIIWEGPVFDPSGYGMASREYVKAMYNNEFPIYVKPVRYYKYGDSFLDNYTTSLLSSLQVDSYTKLDTHIEHKTPNALTPTHNEVNIGYTVWETNLLPDGSLHHLNYKDFIITPSEFSKVCIENSGYKKPVFIIPHIINNSFKKDENYTFDKEETVFLFVGEFTTRKGVDILLKAYKHAFNKNDKVKLLLKTYLLDASPINNGIAKKVKELVGDVSDMAPLMINTEMVSDDKLPYFYSKFADVFVTATRGEGFGLPIAEAMSCGCITIAPDKGGHTDFCNNDNSLLVNSEQRDIPSDMLEKSRMVYEGQKWIETEVHHLAEIMKDVHLNKSKYKSLTDNAVNTINDYCSVESVISKFRKVNN